MKLFQKIVIFMLLGIGVGNVINLIFGILYGQFYPGIPLYIQSFDNLNVAVLIQTLVYAILGILQGLAGKVFQSKLNDNIVIVFVSHYFLIMLPLVLAGYYLKWFSSFTTLILMLITATIVYILIGIARYLSIKKGIREINIKLNDNR